MDDLISRMDAIQACQVGPSDEWSRATKSGYSQAATDCQMNILRIPALPSVGVPEIGEGKVCDRMNATQWSAITAHFSYECEPRTPLPNWNTVAMEAIRLSNELRDARERLVATDVRPPMPSVTVKPLEWRKDTMPSSAPQRYKATTHGGFGDYSVTGYHHEDEWQWFRNGYFVDGHQHHAAMAFEAAKAAAQADYEARILAALDVPPAPDVAQVRAEALEDAAKACDRIAGNTADFPRDHRRAAGQCAAMIRALITTPAPSPARCAECDCENGGKDCNWIAAPSPDVAIIERAILDAQLRCMEQGRIDTPEEIRASAALARKGGGA